MQFLLALLILRLFPQNSPEPPFSWEELNHFDILLIGEAKWQYEHSFWREGFLSNFTGILIKHFLFDGLNTHL